MPENNLVVERVEEHAHAAEQPEPPPSNTKISNADAMVYIRTPVSALVAILCMHVVGACLFHSQLQLGSNDRSWLFLGIWWSHIATSSIGLGDQVPLTDTWAYFVAHFTYLIFGLVFIGLAVTRLMNQYTTLQHAIESKAHVFELSDVELQEKHKEEEAAATTIQTKVRHRLAARAREDSESLREEDHYES